MDCGNTFDWRFEYVLQDQEAEGDLVQDKFALVILNQPLRDINTLRRLWKNSCLRVAADGGANRLLEAARRHGDFPTSREFDNLDVIIGDLDSINEEALTYYRSLTSSPSIIVEEEQESTDFAKAVSYIRRQKPTVNIVAIGSLAGRVDQGLSQLHHLYLFQKGDGYEAGRMFLITEESLTFLLKAGQHQIQVRDEHGACFFGKHVGIIPAKEPSIITTQGLEWDVTNWKTEFGGRMSTSNHILPATTAIRVKTDKDVVFTLALRQ